MTSIVAGVDSRFKFAVPVYGCGFLGENSAWLPAFEKMGKDKADLWLRQWDPSSLSEGREDAHPLGQRHQRLRLPDGLLAEIVPAAETARTLCLASECRTATAQSAKTRRRSTSSPISSSPVASRSQRSQSRDRKKAKLGRRSKPKFRLRKRSWPTLQTAANGKNGNGNQHRRKSTLKRARHREDSRRGEGLLSEPLRRAELRRQHRARRNPRQQMSKPLHLPAEVHGVRVPNFLYGTAWKEDQTQRLVGLALEAGFRGIDTANQRKHYHEAAVGEAVASAIQRGLVKREGLFLQTKFTFKSGQDHRLPYDSAAPVATQVEQSFASSLTHLGVETIDSFLLHGPTQRIGLAAADWSAWRAMEAIHASGRAKLLGVSNVNLEQLEELYRQREGEADFRPEPLLRLPRLGPRGAEILRGQQNRLSGLLAPHGQRRCARPSRVTSHRPAVQSEPHPDCLPLRCQRRHAASHRNKQRGPHAGRSRGD